MRVAIAGLGAAAQAVYLPLLTRRRDLFEVTAVCDLDPRHAGAIGLELGLAPERCSGDAARMLDEGGFDALIVLTAGTHGPLVAEALRRGYHVLSEKPLAYTRAEAARIAEVLEKAGGDGPRFMTGYMKQYDPATTRLAALLATLGGPRAVRHLDVTVLHPTGESQLAFARLRPARPTPEALAPHIERDERALDVALGPATPRLRALYTDIVLGSMCHDLSLIRMLTGPPAGVDHVAVWPEGSAPLSVEVTGRLPAGGRYGMRWHYLADHPAYRETVTVHHEQGSLELVFPSPYLMNAPTTLTASARDGTAETRTVHRDVSEAFELQLVAFHALVTEGRPPLTGLDGALSDIVIAQRIVRVYAESAGLPIGGEAVEP